MYTATDEYHNIDLNHDISFSNLKLIEHADNTMNPKATNLDKDV
jgi:hypothetical protein